MGSHSVVYFIPIHGHGISVNASGGATVPPAINMDSRNPIGSLTSKGFLRIELAKYGVFCFEWSISLSHLESFSTLPHSVRLQDERIWTSFWSTMTKQSKRHLIVHRCALVLVWLLVAVFVSIPHLPSIGA
jgi:hypothetical protein